MAMRFIGKVVRKRVVKPIKNSAKYQNYSSHVENNNDIKEIKEEIVEPQEKKENKKQKKGKDMVDEKKLSQMEAIANSELPKTNVKIEKADKGLYERTENSTILLTEDNKMLLND